MKKSKKTMAGLSVMAYAACIVVLVVSCAGTSGAGGVGIKSSYDVVIIGSGGAGLSAAVSAREAGADVVIFEKMGIFGGNTLRATGGINAAGTNYQEKAGIKDSPDLFYADTMKGGYNKNNPALVRNLAEKSVSSVEWLVKMGADLTDVGLLAGASVNRAHRPSGVGRVGPEIAMTLEKRAQALGIHMFSDAKVTGITIQNGRVKGVELTYEKKNYRVKAKAVILATGGFGANNEMASALVPALKGFTTTNHPGATGDGIQMAEKIGAALVDMTEIQTHPTHVPNKEMITEAVRGNGAILVNKKGARFVGELETRDVVSAAILAQEGGISYLIFDDSVRKSLIVIEDYIKMGIVLEAPTPEALAGLIGADAHTLAGTITKYNSAVSSKKDIEFGRTDMPRSLSTAP
jgi:fumarate reductase flavoprotein subunit